jgi:N-acetylneuraminate synthase/N,N'-diacetyllegionaminate synthase
MPSATIRPIKIGERLIGPGRPVYVIAEAGVSHNGSVECALRMCGVAKDCGADAVKFQAFRAEEIASEEAEQAEYQRRNAGEAKSQREMLKSFELSADDFAKLTERCREIGIEFLASPFDIPSLEMLVALGVRAIKMASTEITDVPLLERAARTGLPLILSTGAATMNEITEGVRVVRAKGATDIILLHCVSAYPTPLDQQNLGAIRELEERFRCVVGYSDHSTEVMSGQLAVGFGASVLEKHFTLSKSDAGPDHAMSLEPEELRTYVSLARQGAALEVTKKFAGVGAKRPLPIEDEVRRVSRKSVAAKVAIKAGTKLTRGMLTTLRPGTGIPPANLVDLVGCVAARDIPAGVLIAWDMLKR